MEFGEIIEPSTRALIDEELEEYPDYEEPVFEWKPTSNALPEIIDTLIIIEAKKVTDFFELFIYNKKDYICILNNEELSIHKLENNKYILTYTPKKYSTGQVVEEISKWLKKAKKIYSITCLPIVRYLSNITEDKPEYVIRVLSNSSSTLNYKKLEAPNLVTGLGSNILSYCIHTGLECTLIVFYSDNALLDSINSQPLMELTKKLGLSFKKDVVLQVHDFPSNLYM